MAAAQSEVWLKLSHWTGATAALQVSQGWVYGNKYQYIFGKFTYDGNAIYGSGSTRYGVPTDSYGRLIYLDTQDPPAYGTGGAARTRSSRTSRTGRSATASTPTTPAPAATALLRATTPGSGPPGSARPTVSR